MSFMSLKTVHVNTAKWVFAVIMLLIAGGCGDFFAHKPTEIQTRVILNELGQIRENTNTENPLPEIYRSPPKRINVKNGIKLFYFTRHHSVEKLSGLVVSQLGLKVDKSKPTNQLIIHCASDEEANTVLEFLSMVDVPPIQVNIDCLILERFADVTMDWETTIQIDNLLGDITLGGGGKSLATFPGASLRESLRSEFGLNFGYFNENSSGDVFKAIVDVLVSRGYLKILMNPVLETVNGQEAEITTRDFAPLEKIVTKEGVDPYSLTEYIWVEDTLKVTPHVYADGSIGLNTYIKLGSKSKPEGVVQTSIITERFIRVEENRIEPGKSLVIGGLRKSEERAVVRGIPFFKDLPLIGILFSSKDYEEKATEVIFILTPSISSGGIEYTEMVEGIRKKQAKPKYERGLHETLTDPFGGRIYLEQIEQQAALAEFEKLKSDIEKAEALEEVVQMKEKLLEAAKQVIGEQAKVRQALTEAQKAREDAEKSKKDAERIRAEAAKAKEAAEKAVLKAVLEVEESETGK